MGIVDFSVREVENLALGRVGSTLMIDTTAYTGEYMAIFCVDDTIFTTLTDANRDGGAFTGKTFLAGSTIFGTFTAITLASGTALAYKSGT